MRSEVLAGRKSQPKLSAEEFLKEWSTAEIARMVFDDSDTDMLVAMPSGVYACAVFVSLRTTRTPAST